MESSLAGHERCARRALLSFQRRNSKGRASTFGRSTMPRDWPSHGRRCYKIQSPGGGGRRRLGLQLGGFYLHGCSVPLSVFLPRGGKDQEGVLPLLVGWGYGKGFPPLKKVRLLGSFKSAERRYYLVINFTKADRRKVLG